MTAALNFRASITGAFLHYIVKKLILYYPTDLQGTTPVLSFWSAQGGPKTFLFILVFGDET